VNLDWQSILKRHPVFSALDEKEVDYLIEVSDEKEYGKDDVILREGERGGSIFIIGFGAVEVVLPWGGEQTLHLSTLSKGEFFGEMALFEKPCAWRITSLYHETCSFPIL
jgi:CRP-like cAMP-binding protein